jgi:hypothetical protein
VASSSQLDHAQSKVDLRPQFAPARELAQAKARPLVINYDGHPRKRVSRCPAPA